MERDRWTELGFITRWRSTAARGRLREQGRNEKGALWSPGFVEAASVVGGSVG